MHNPRRSDRLRYPHGMRRFLTAVALIALASRARAEQKNLQILTGMSDLELQRTMNMMRSSLGVNCDYCHVVDDKGSWDFASDAKREKETARDMMQMAEKLNHEQFGGRAAISCNTCHRGSTHPMSLVTLPQTAPPFPTPKSTRPTLPSLEDVTKHYAAAMGDASRLGSPRILRGTREGFDGKPLPIEIQESNGRVHVETTMGEAKLEQWWDTKSGASRDSGGVHKFGDSQAENFRELTSAYSPQVPGAIPKDARVLRKEKVGDHDTILVAASLDGRTHARYYFDAASGLLVRRMIITDGPIGPLPQQTDFEDYRDVGGTKFPFMVRVSLVDPWVSATRHYSDVQLGAKLEDTVFVPPQ